MKSLALQAFSYIAGGYCVFWLAVLAFSRYPFRPVSPRRFRWCAHLCFALAVFAVLTFIGNYIFETPPFGIDGKKEEQRELILGLIFFVGGILAYWSALVFRISRSNSNPGK